MRNCYVVATTYDGAFAAGCQLLSVPGQLWCRLGSDVVGTLRLSRDA